MWHGQNIWLIICLTTIIVISLRGYFYQKQFIIMLKKTIVALLVMVAIFNAQSASALGIDYGVGAGANISSIRSLSDDINIGSGWGFQVGAHVGLDLGIVAITPELWYMKSSATYDAQKMGGQFGNLKIESLDVPIIASISILGPIKLKVGPSFSLWNRATLPDGDEYYNVKHSYGYVAGIGLEFINIGIDLRYNGQFTSTTLPTSVTSANEDYKIRANSISVVVSYSF